MTTLRLIWLAGLIPGCLMLSCGCQSPNALMPTPNLYVGTRSNPFADVPESFRKTEIDVLYATDRQPAPHPAVLEYTDGRSDSLAFGSCRVQIGGEDVTWDELVAASRVRKRSGEFALRVVATKEQGRFPDTPLTLIEVDDELQVDPTLLSARDEMAQRLREVVRRRLALTDRKEIYMFVHGYNTSFDMAVMEIAELWHFLGRQGVPVAYAWPATKKYAQTRESGEFTIFHLKMFIDFLAAIPEVDKINLIAHSRGTDVLTSALREMLIEARGMAKEPKEAFKIGNLVLAAPDLDFDVVRQRLAAEGFGRMIDHLTIYVSESDKALGVSAKLWDSGQRVGRLRPDDFKGRYREMLQLALNGSIVDADVSSGFLGHSYFRSSPAVSSDIILILRDNLQPGAEYGRPLILREGVYWAITDEYLASPDGNMD